MLGVDVRPLATITLEARNTAVSPVTIQTLPDFLMVLTLNPVLILSRRLRDRISLQLCQIALLPQVSHCKA